MGHPAIRLPKPLAAAAGSALIVAFGFGGLVAAHALPTTPNSSHASATAATQAADANAHAAEVQAEQTSSQTDDQPATNDAPDPTLTPQASDHGATVSAVAQDATLVGGPHDNHGWYVSCVARGGTVTGTGTTATCTPATTLATLHGSSANHGKSGSHGPSSSQAPTQP
ncbi:MAG TPA: hypothetical protein VFW92_03220 [Candidatus Limnocylindrales bacterium]|nr:hypothetical protein [Candidatus Limnocylindrales bacterium]